MPEGPEVKIITNWLDAYTKGTTIMECPDTYKKASGYSSLVGYMIDKVICKGKQIFFHLKHTLLNKTVYLNSRLAMEGKWTPTQESHVRFWFKLFVPGTDTQGTRYLYFCDTRNFGGFDMLDEYGYTNKLKMIGPDLL